MMWLTLVEQLVDGCFSSIPRRKPLSHHAHQALLIAHRGAHDNKKGILENTLQAFKLAKDSGCWGIEFDVHATADGILVVNHDPDLRRLWNQNLSIAQLRFNELRALVPGVPSVAEVLDACRGMHFFIEVKAPFVHEEALVQILKDLVPGKDYHLLSLQEAIFRSFVQFPKEVLLLVAVCNVTPLCDISMQEHYGGVMGNYLLLTDKHRDLLSKANQLAGVGFVDSKNSLYRELNRGMEWIFTNKAVKVSRYLQRLQETND